MKNSYSNIFAFNKKILNKTIKNLNNGNVAGLPTETVYGLGGNAYSKISIQRIYRLKERPSSNPLIIHYHNLKDALNDIEINENFIKLYKSFCPGPITFVLKKKYNSKIHPFASAKLNTVAVRFPKHKIIRTILKEIDFPLAMPSANKSTKVSPVKAKDVFDEFKRKIHLIIDGGKCKIGIESTVIDLTGFPKILRPGIIGKNTIEKVLKKKIKNNIKGKKIKSPGIMKKHYSPGIPVLINQKKYSLTKSPTSGSKLAVGSSKKSNLGLLIRDFASETLFFCPDDSSPVFLPKNLLKLRSSTNSSILSTLLLTPYNLA